MAITLVAVDTVLTPYGGQLDSRAPEGVALPTPNVAPTIVGAPATLTTGASFPFTFNFAPYTSDANDDVLTYSLQGTSYTGITINSSTGVLTVTSAAAAAVRDLVIRATDPSALYAESPCQVTISAPATISAIVTSGESWALPAEYPTKSPYGGLYTLWGTAVRPVAGASADLFFVGGRWRNLEESEGVINTTRLDTGVYNSPYNLSELAAAGKKAILWVAFGEYDEGQANYDAPGWYTDTYAPAVVNDNGTGQPWGLAVWNQQTPWLNFIAQMGALYGPGGSSPYAGVIEKVYIGTFEAGGEFNINSDTIANATAAGLTTGAGGMVETYSKALIDAWVAAFGRDRVIWEGCNSIADNLGQGGLNATAYALGTVGTNVREGFAEHWHQSTSASRTRAGLGQAVSPALGTAGGSYLLAQTVDQWGYSPFADKFYGDELENDAKSGVPTTSGSAGDYTYWRLALLNAARKGVTHLALPDQLRDDTTYSWAVLSQFKTLRDYFRKTAGYPVASSPDAWCVLQQWNDGPSVFAGARKFNNLEKFLTQRDIAGDGTTALAETSNRWAANVLFWASGMSISEARRTQVASGHRYMYFDAAAGWAASPLAAQISVYYKDSGTASWRLEYSSASSSLVTTEFVVNQNTGTWKTATFTLPSVSLAGAFSGSTDFRLYNESGADLSVGAVRLIRTVPV